MKKLVVAAALSAALASSVVAEEKSGVFVGVHGGLGMVPGVIFNAAGNETAWDASMGPETETSINAGAKVGYQHWFIPYFGLRAYFQYDFNTGRTWQGLGDSSLSAAFQTFTGNIDLMANFINTESFSLGVFAGIGAGYTMTIWSDENVAKALDKTMEYVGLALPINVGIATTIAESHKIELGARIPALPAFYQTKGDTNNKAGFGFAPMSVNLGYSYIF